MEPGSINKGMHANIQKKRKKEEKKNLKRAKKGEIFENLGLNVQKI